MDNVGLVRTQGLQLWMNKTLAEAGWTASPGILSGYVEPFDTWSDMSDLIAGNDGPHPQNANRSPTSATYFPTISLRPSTIPPIPAKERQQVKDYARQFLDGPLLPIFPTAADPANPGHFNDDRPCELHRRPGADQL